MAGDIITSERICSEDAKDSGGTYEGELKQVGDTSYQRILLSHSE